jgi:orotidine-5'-phosphate decarboxylase
MKNPIILALDVPTPPDARELIARLRNSVTFFKVGMELFTAAGMPFVRELLETRKQVFLDLKYYDIPETVKRAVSIVAETGVKLLTVHGSRAVMQAAVDARGRSPLQLLGVAVLTAFDQADLEDLGYPCPVEDLVALRVKKAMEVGMDGVICSAKEVAMVRSIAGPQAVLVTPGVRSAGTEVGDQKRVATPADAIRSGANYLVIGRQVTRAADPRAEAMRILSEVGAV